MNESSFTESSFLNPMIQKFCSRDAETEGLKASCRGISLKSVFFLFCAVTGLILFTLLDELIPSGNGRQAIHIIGTVLTAAFILLAVLSPLLSFWGRPLAILSGTLFSLCAGYSYVWLGSLLLSPAFFSVIRLAFVLTVLLLLTLSVLTAAGFPKSGKRLPLFLVSVPVAALISALLFLIFWLIPGVRSAVSCLIDHPLTGALLSLLYMCGACLLLIPDFRSARQKTESGVSIRYDWAAAFGLIYSLFYLPFKMDVLIRRISIFKKKEKTQ